MRILIVGCGAREQAIAFKFHKSATPCEIFSWPSSAAMRIWAKPTGLNAEASLDQVASWGVDNGIRLVVVGPETPLSNGIADRLAEKSIPVFGPKKFAAQLESSKRFAKDIMRRNGIPTADYAVHSERMACQAHAKSILTRSGRVVLKASGLAGGKGVFVCANTQEVDEAIARLYETSMQSAAEEVVVEEFMAGRESSFFCSIGTVGIRPIGFAVDHKRLSDGDAGPNTGGMGCYAPVPWLPEDAEEQVMTRIVRPLVDCFKRERIDYCGWLYVGLMWDRSGPRVVEFNVRLGDPEAEVLAMSDSSDWLEEIMQQVGLKPATSFDLRREFAPAVCVVMASSDYPYAETRLESSVLPRNTLNIRADDVMVTGSAVGEAESEEMIVTQRGRVFTIAAKGATLQAARQRAYAVVEDIQKLFPTAKFRRDIAANL